MRNREILNVKRQNNEKMKTSLDRKTKDMELVLEMITFYSPIRQELKDIKERENKTKQAGNDAYPARSIN